jgi:hypothetical protein
MRLQRWPNKGAAANSHRAFRSRGAGNLCIACVLHPRRPVAVAELGSLDLMRSTAASLPLMLLLASCIELPPQPPPTLVLDGIPIYGRAQSLSKSDLRAAIAEDRRSSPGNKIYSIEVASSSEVQVYHTERSKRLEEYDVLRRMHGSWQAQERMISGSALLVPTD